MIRRSVCWMLAKHSFFSAVSNRPVQLLMGLILLLLLYANISSYTQYRQQITTRNYYRELVRNHWEEMPDKHPHRMAHYGYIAFRSIDPLSLFDRGIDTYAGNAIFLEAHKQNTVNFSEAGLSTGLLRFGEITQSMILQLLVPLLLFFIGFGAIAADRENGTLKMLFSQGTSWKELLLGKCLGLWLLAMVFLLVGMFLLVGTSLSIPELEMNTDWWIRSIGLLLLYSVYFWSIAAIATWVSAISKSARLALVSLIGMWLLMGIILPRAIQSGASWVFPAPSKIHFDSMVEQELIKKGDSHDPNDPYYKALKDSVLRAHNVSSIEELPFNYSGFQMKEGERISTELYNQQMAVLQDIYKKQNNLSRLAGWVNPFMPIRLCSMSFSGTDFSSYTRFQTEAENYRYRLAQQMNDWQIQYISNKKPAPGEKGPAISRDFWKAFPAFTYPSTNWKKGLQEAGYSLLMLLAWFLFSVWLLIFRSQKLNVL